MEYGFDGSIWVLVSVVASGRAVRTGGRVLTGRNSYCEHGTFHARHL